ncbi:type VI secretion system baseplate subunit TssG [Trinickia caryophylli]|uniref:Type VI secretion system protein ImpH n=1 Tax=Trinickia caryophylli TaxID=28094 RepID=A0A1X7D5F1_TRICW|nr:type VI secretion system baseplate subunit TssG [Trinickia caryophylli]PMS12713.1 hypothetical protein C0Z17_07725 [Trinickia caryophylli]TRX15118.1 type VI secretion system baseplate subunit TssG [Trinickia caryophylli]WQE14979.1 type VI secretion system baseplate subunit TssG [Trinickia caryophylli]SMF09203.1 type VI secretion system protein ImpH [Trinickia caryophylli]GLU31292.1 hypothetical protein Busp01_11340 [Trinickia caryophylli]
MATDRRGSAASIEACLFSEPDRFDVFQLVRLLRIRDSSRPDAAAALKRRLRWRLMSGEADTRSFVRFARRLRFSAELSAAFPGRELTACTIMPQQGAGHDRRGRTVPALPAPLAPGEHEVVELKTPNYCVASELGPLPEPFLEWVRERTRDDDRTFAAFLDLFNHRIHVLRHQLKAMQDVALDYALPQDTLQADYLASLAGIASLNAEAQLALPRRAWLGMAATLADPRRAAAPALAALRQYLGAPRARLVPLVGNWRARSSTSWMALGQASTLGGDAVLGTRVWNQMASVYLRVPDIDYGRLCALLPPRREESGEPAHGVDARGPAWPAERNEGAGEAGASRAREPEPDPQREERSSPIDGYEGLAQMVRLLFDRRVDCIVALTTDARHLPPSVLTATPGVGATAPSAPALNGALADGVPYRGLLLGQTAWLAGKGGAAGGRRHVRYTIAADPSGAAA